MCSVSQNKKIKFKFNNTIRFLKLKIEILIQIDKTKIKTKLLIKIEKRNWLTVSNKQIFIGRLFIYTSDRSYHQCYH